MKILKLLLGFVIATPVFAQSNGNVGVGEFKSTATIENSCLIAADNVNFGQVFAPLTTQGTQSQMKVLCSKDASYTIDLAYGGVYGAGSQSDGKTYVAEVSGGTSSNDVRIQNIYSFSVDGVRKGNAVSCYLNGNVYFYSQSIAELYGATQVKVAIKDEYNACVGVQINKVTLSSFSGSPAYAYGVMNGGLKSDKLAYKITVPGDITKVWNAGNNSYTTIGTGGEQVIDINAQIVPEKSSSLYVAQDIYTDTVTAVISY